jgi:hypothetical protein
MGSVPVVVLDVLVGCEKSITLLTWEFTGRLAAPQWCGVPLLSRGVSCALTLQTAHDL